MYIFGYGSLINSASRKLTGQTGEAIPVIAHGGAGCISDISNAIKVAGASAVALGSMVVFQKKDMGVLVNFPEQEQLEKAFA